MCIFLCVHNESVSHGSTFMQLDMMVAPATIFSESRLQRPLQRSSLKFFWSGGNNTTHLLCETDLFCISK